MDSFNSTVMQELHMRYTIRYLINELHFECCSIRLGMGFLNEKKKIIKPHGFMCICYVNLALKE